MLTVIGIAIVILGDLRYAHHTSQAALIMHVAPDMVVVAAVGLGGMPGAARARCLAQHRSHKVADDDGDNHELGATPSATDPLL